MTRDPVVVVPADLQVEDRIVGPVTFRMAAWLAGAVVGVALVATARGDVALTAIGAVAFAVGVAGACLRPGGRPVAAWVAPLVAYRRRRRARRATVDERPVETAAPTDEPVETAQPTDATERDDSHEVLVIDVVPRRRARVAAVVGVGVLACLAVGVGVVAPRLASKPARAVPPVPAPEPQDPVRPGPVVVVVPVDPFTGWEVTGDDDVLFECGC